MAQTMRRRDRQIPEKQAWEILDQCDYAVLAMTAEDGSPYCVPLNVVREGQSVYFHGAQAGRKAACLQKAPRVCLTCVETCEIVPERYTTRYASAVAFGRVTEVEEPEEKARALRFLCQRYTPEHLAGAEKEITQSLRGTAVWKLTVEEITGKANRP